MTAHKQRKLAVVTGLFAADGLFFSLCDPNRLPAVVIIAGFGLVVLTLYAIIDLLLALAERLVPFAARTKQRIALAGTLVLGLLLAMQSIGQLTGRDILAVIPLVLVLAVYFSYFSTKRT